MTPDARRSDSLYEGRLFPIDDFSIADLAHLRRLTAGNFTLEEGGGRIQRMVGHLLLPSGRRLVIRSPKAPVCSLLPWMAFADPTLASLRFHGFLPKSADAGDLGAVVALLFTVETLRVLKQRGLQRAYVRTPVVSATVRGRIDFAQQARLGGDLSRMPCVVWDRLTRTPLNDLLAAAASRVHRDPCLRQAAGQPLFELRAVLGNFDGSPDPDLATGRRPLTRLEEPFAVSCALARLLLRATSLKEGVSATGMAFLINLEELFEAAVARAFTTNGVACRPKYPAAYTWNTSERTAARAAMEIDLLLEVGGWRVVVDAKYKTKPAAANLQQIIAYCHLVGATRSVLVFPGEHLDTSTTYLFPAGAGGDPIKVFLAELRTDATDVEGWQASGRRLVKDVLAKLAVAQAASPRVSVTLTSERGLESSRR